MWIMEEEEQANGRRNNDNNFLLPAFRKVWQKPACPKEAR